MRLLATRSMARSGERRHKAPPAGVAPQITKWRRRLSSLEQWCWRAIVARLESPSSNNRLRSVHLYTTNGQVHWPPNNSVLRSQLLKCVAQVLKSGFPRDAIAVPMSDPTKTMTPPGKSLKRPTRSPLQELDDDEDLELQDASGSFQDGAVAQMANAVRSEIQRALAPMEQQLSHIHVSLGQRVQEMENTMSQQSYRIEKLEKLFENEGTPRSTTSEKDISLEKKIADLQSQLSALRRTMVVGGLGGFSCTQEATSWLTDN